MNKNLKKLDYMSLEIKDSILIGHYDNIQITLEMAKNIVKSRLEYQENHSYPAIAHGSSILSSTKEARDYFASTHGSEGILSLAIIMSNTFGRVMGNFYLRVNKPIIPTKLFSTEEEAIVWSRKFQK